MDASSHDRDRRTNPQVNTKFLYSIRLHEPLKYWYCCLQESVFCSGAAGIDHPELRDGARAKGNRRSSNGLGLEGRRPRAVVEDVALAEATRTRYLNYALSVIT